MRIAVAQMQTGTGRFSENLGRAKNFAARAKDAGADIVLFPEMFLCGFDYAKNLEFLRDGEFSIEDELSNVARENGIWICGSNPHANPEDQKRPFNRMTLFNSDGAIAAYYDKVHLFGLFGEDRHVGAGNRACIAETPFGKIGLAICYDLRFPELFRRMALDGAKIVLFSACFPYPRDSHFDTLVRARAMEEQCWFAAANRVGEERLPSGLLKYFGSSAILTPNGDYAAKAPKDEEALIFSDVSLEDVEKVRRHIDTFSDRRPDVY